MATKRPRTNQKPKMSSRRQTASATVLRARARSLAAKKGAETRRLNKLRAERAAKRVAKKRSDAAKKGWETRRRKEHEKKRKKKRKRGGDVITNVTAEFAVSADYRAGKSGSSVTVQIAMRGPENATKDELIQAVTTTINQRGRAPAGYDVAIVDWLRGAIQDAYEDGYAGGPFTNADPHAWDHLSGPLALAKLRGPKHVKI